MQTFLTRSLRDGDFWSAMTTYVCICIYIYKFSPRGFSEPVYKYIQGQTVEGLRKSARAAHIFRRTRQPIRSGAETDHNTGITTLLFARSVWVLLSPSIEGSRD